ncbi:MAG TPA: hypothetical protein VLV48_06085 [Thermoanaerobaculia bacterium]|nr:hypothetical protein [Thermoanaerobaculia bacterium]
MPFKVQKKVGAGKWEDVETVDDLDAAIKWAVGNERHAEAGQSKAGDISTRVLDGKRVIWK